MDQSKEDGDPSSSGSEREEDGSPKLSERRRRHEALIVRWIADQHSSKAGGSTKKSQDGSEATDEELTVQELMARHANKKIIETPREYQMELFERAKQKNTLAVLDTGTGKTLIAALLLRWMLDRELQHRALGKRRRLAFFIVGGVALAFQQHAVLQCNLDYKIEKLYGNLNVDFYSREQWAKIFAENMGIVCTAEVLYQCLSKSFVGIADINLLIFDEAHHTKKDHSFSRIMRDYYHKTPRAERPRVFGMTASPVDAKVDVQEAAYDLEMLLDSHIATSKMIVTNRPKEQMLLYGRPVAPYNTALCQKLYKCLGKESFFSEFILKAQNFTSSLGEWCGDQYWKQCFGDEDSQKMENIYKRQTEKKNGIHSVVQLNKKAALIEEARTIVKNHQFLSPHDMQGRAISAKVERLQKLLSSEFENPTKSKCVIFVDHRHIAFLLVELFGHIGSPHLKCAAMVGTRTPEVGEMAFSLATQIRTLSKFEKGEYNCLFATTVAEEGIDVADCNIVVRFDLYHTMIQYVQSRGRARHQNSKYIHMLEKGNVEHDERFKMARESETKMRDFVEKLPPDRLLLEEDPEAEQALQVEKDFEIYSDPTTGAKISYRSSQTILHHYLDHLTQEAGLLPPRPTYIIQPHGGKFVCEIILPEQAHIKSIIGKPFARKSWAKCSAAFNACKKLKQIGLLDEHLMPKIQKVRPKMRNAHLSVNEHKKDSYKVRHKPTCWQNGRGKIPCKLYATVLDLSNESACIKPHVPWLLLTREEIMEVPTFPLWPQYNEMVEVICTRLAGVMEVDGPIIAELTNFTLQIFNDVFNKLYECDEAQMSYWVAPLFPRPKYSANSEASQLIDWEAMCASHSPQVSSWSPDMDAHSMIDRYLIDPGDGSRRFFTEALVSDLKPEDNVPSGVVPTKAKLMKSIWDYSNSTWGKYRRGVESAATQPVLKAYQPLTRHNIFENWSQKEQETSTLAYICPELLHISGLSTSIASMAYMFPAIIWRIEAHLIAEEACAVLGLTMKPSLSLEALTKDSDNTEEHRKQQISFQRGMGRNYERLEFIGDSFLKMATTISLFTLNPKDDEFTSHVNRMIMICNKNLYETALEKEIYQYIRAEGFSRRLWYPQGLKLLKGKGAGKSNSSEEAKASFSNKTIADVCEALIGAALVSFMESGDMDMAVKAVSATVADKSHTMQQWTDYYKLYKKPTYLLGQNTAAQIELAKTVASEHDYKFKYPRLLQSAFTHPSYPFSWDQIPNYQRLEFLGDALLDVVCVNFLYTRYPDRDPQWLTEHKMAMVSNKFLGALCARLGFNRHLKSNTSQVLSQVRIFCDEIEEVERNAGNAPDYWTLIPREPPKCLADIVESYLGAVFVDSKYSFREIERFFNQHIAPYFQDMTMYDTFASNHPMIALSSMLTETYNCVDYRIASHEMPSEDGKPPQIASVVIVHNLIIEGVWSTSTRYGKVKAATKAKAQIEGLAPYEYRRKYLCDCKVKESASTLDILPQSQTVGTAV